MQPRGKHFLIASSILLLLALLAVALVPGWRAAALSRLSGEPFFRGRSASFWRQQLREENENGPGIILTQDGDTGVIRAFIEEGGASPLPVLLVLLADDDPYIRRRAAEALGRMHAHEDAAVAALIERLRDGDEAVRWQAAESLGRIGPAAVRAVPELVQAAGDASEIVRLTSARALGRVGASEHDQVPALIGCLEDSSELVRWEAAGALERLGPAARAALPALQAAQQDASPYVRAAAARAMDRIRAK